MRYTDEGNTSSRNMTSEEAYMNTSRILLEVPRSRLPYERFQVDVALQVGGEVGPFVPDGRIHGKYTCGSTHIQQEGNIDFEMLSDNIHSFQPPHATLWERLFNTCLCLSG